ncbi:VrrB protein, partial [Bacillus cytotoxicus]|nr:VrrB protein [Bacillus cytotoxicus]
MKGMDNNAPHGFMISGDHHYAPMLIGGGAGGFPTSVAGVQTGIPGGAPGFPGGFSPGAVMGSQLGIPTAFPAPGIGVVAGTGGVNPYGV